MTDINIRFGADGGYSTSLVRDLYGVRVSKGKANAYGDDRRVYNIDLERIGHFTIFSDSDVFAKVEVFIEENDYHKLKPLLLSSLSSEQIDEMLKRNFHDGFMRGSASARERVKEALGL